MPYNFVLKSGKGTMYITLEGIDGCGKSTQVKKLEKWFREQGKEVVVVREPGGTDYGENFRSFFKNHSGELSSFTTLLGMYGARHQLMLEKIYPALKEGKIVISDRCSLSSWAYQFPFVRNIKPSTMVELERGFRLVRGYEVVKPHIFILDVSLHVSNKRLMSRNKLDAFDLATDEEKEGVRSRMHTYVGYCSSGHDTINANLSEEDVFNNLLIKINKI